MLVCCFQYPGMLTPTVKPTHQFMVSSPWLPAGDHILLRDILARLFSLSIHQKSCNSCAYFDSLSYLSFVCFFVSFGSISGSFWSRNWIIFLILFHWSHKLNPFFTHFLLYISQFDFQPSICPHLSWWPLPTSANSMLVLILLQHPRRIHFLLGIPKCLLN